MPKNRTEWLTRRDKDEFFMLFSGYLDDWLSKYEKNLLIGYRNYAWTTEDPNEAKARRLRLEEEIGKFYSQNKYLSKDYFKRIIQWGMGAATLRKTEGNREEDIMQVTHASYRLLREGKVLLAYYILTVLNGIGGPGAGKILTFIDPNNLGCFDSRTGYSLRWLKTGNGSVFPVPPGRDLNILSDYTSNSNYAIAFEKFNYLCNYIKDIFNSHRVDNKKDWRAADIEMGLWMLGKPGSKFFISYEDDCNE